MEQVKWEIQLQNQMFSWNFVHIIALCNNQDYSDKLDNIEMITILKDPA